MTINGRRSSRGVYLIGNKTDKLVTDVLVQHLATGVLSTLPLQEYVRRGIEPADGTLPWQEDITPKPAAPSARPFQPDPSQWSGSSVDDAAARIATSRSQRNDAVLNSGGSEAFPPQSATSPTIQVQPVGASGVVRQEPSPSSYSFRSMHFPKAWQIPAAGVDRRRNREFFVGPTHDDLSSRFEAKAYHS
jgi:hypothetical protein